MKQTQAMLQTVFQHFPNVTPGETRRMKVSGMTFDISTYAVAGLGHVSSMIASGFFGLMKMDTLIITPTAVDMPLFSYDRVLAMGNDTLIFELYDTFLDPAQLPQLAAVKAEAGELPEHDLGEHWYDPIKLGVSLSKKGKKAHTPAFDACACKYLEAFLTEDKAAAPCPADAKREKAAVYVEGLLEHGGPSTDVFKKGIGEDATAELFRHTLFATLV